MLKKIETKSIQEVGVFAYELLQYIKKATQHKSSNVIVGLSGPLGAGKTTLVQQIGKHLDVAESITSPTFILRRDYKTNDAVFNNLIHIDLYRLEKEEEIKTIGWDIIIRKPATLTIIEWVEKAKTYIPKDAYTVTVSVCDETHTFTLNV